MARSAQSIPIVLFLCAGCTPQYIVRCVAETSELGSGRRIGHGDP